MIGIVLALGAIVSVLAFGGVETLGFAPAQIAVIVLSTVAFWRKGWPSVSRLTLFVLGTLLVIPLLQLIPLPRSSIAAFFPARVTLADNLDTLSAAMSSARQTLTLTVNSYETQLALLRLVCYILVFLLAFQVYQLQGEPTALIGTLVGLGVLESVYGIAQYFTGWQYFFYYDKWVSVHAAAGTYVNKNHFAGLLEMVLPFPIAVILFRKQRQGSSGRSPWVEAIISPTTSHLLRDVVLFALICVGLIFSGSRMGIVAAMVGILVTGSLAVLQHRRRWTLAVLLFILAVPAAYSLWIGLSPVVERFEKLEISGPIDLGRLQIWRDTLALIRDYPLLGTGLGTYHSASMHYQTEMFDYLYGHAHNDYLEFAADIGIPATVLLFGSLWMLVAILVRRVHRLERSRDKVAAAGCAGAMAAMLIHGLTDFNLQIPANAYIFAWIAGIAAALARKPLTGSRASTPRQV